MFKIQIPESVRFIIQTIEQAGFEAYAVGGCVRDSILGRIPDDWDITTSAKPEEIKQLFKHTVDTGIQHGTVTVLIKKECYEVTTYRIDGEYEDSRHPKEVNFTSLLSEDLRRRDFTINAMAYNEERGIVDLFGGQEDLRSGIIRCVGNPEERFLEDALRIMRAVRFSAQLGYEIEEHTRCAIKKLACTLERISVERIQVELVKTLVSAHPEYILKMYELGLTKVFLPEFDRMMVTSKNKEYHCNTVGMHTVEVLKAVKPNKITRIAALLHDIAKPEVCTSDDKDIDHFMDYPKVGSEMARKILKRLRFDNDTIQKVSLLILYHDYSSTAGITPAVARKLIRKVQLDNFPMLLDIRRADVLAQSERERSEKLENVECLSRYYQEVLDRDLCVSLKDLAVSGNDLIKAGMKPGQELGKALEQMLEAVLEEPDMNEKTKLLTLVKEWGYF